MFDMRVATVYEKSPKVKKYDMLMNWSDAVDILKERTNVLNPVATLWLRMANVYS